MWPYNLNYDNTCVTVELGRLIEMGVNIWDFNYPSYYTGDDKTAFEQKVIDHYRFRQIGQETPGRWLHYFRTRIREIMPYYIQLYESQELMQSLEDPFGNVDITETFEQITSGERSGSVIGEHSSTVSGESSVTVTGESSSTSNTTSSGTVTGESSSTSNTTSSGTSETNKTANSEKTGESSRKHSNTPQGSITNIDNFLTEATVEDTSESEDITESVDTSTSATAEAKTTGNDSSTSTGSESTETEGTDSSTSTGSESTGTEGTDSSTSQATESGTVTHTLTRKGNQGVNTYAHDMKELRETFLNIDMMIINELKDLFIQVY